MSGLQIRELSSALATVAKTELNENPAKMREDVEYIRNWLKMQPHIIGRTDDQFLVTFLRGCKYSYEKCKEKLDMYFTLRTAMPEVFGDRDPSLPNIQEAINHRFVLILPQPENISSTKVTLIRLSGHNPHKLGLTDVLKVTYMMFDISLMEDDNITVCGENLIVDLAGLSLAHIAQYTPTFIRNMAHSIQDAYPIRPKGIHFVNPLSIFDAILKVFSSLLGSKIRDRIFVHDTLESLYKHVDRNVLPTEYGGNGGSLQSMTEEWQKRLMSRRDWLIDDSKYKTDESRRLHKSKKAEELFGEAFGTIGSFRNLEFD